MGLLLILVLIVFLFGGFPAGVYQGQYRTPAFGVLTALLVVVLLLILLGRI